MPHHLILILISLLSFESWAQSNVPASDSSVKPAIEARVFKRDQDIDYVAEALWREKNHGSLKSLGLSVRKRLPWHYMFGFYLKHTWGERYNDSWSKDVSNNQWRWEDVDGVGESKLGLLAQKRWGITSKLAAGLRLSLENRFKEQKMFAAIRPGISYKLSSHWMSYLRYEAYMLLVSSPATFYKQGIYLGALNSSFQNFMIGPFVRLERHEWWTSKDFKRITGGEYRSHDKLVNIGLTAVYSL